ncbi:MAG: DinB family protein [Anaerolineae bacterium]|nr:DinB family protein [Anaerolineae bacterium]
MTTPSQMFINQFDTTYSVLQRQTEGLTHEDSLLQLPFRGNCLNWILGHLIGSRNTILKFLGETAIWDDATLAIYSRGSEPITVDNAYRALPLSDLMKKLDETQELLRIALANKTADDWKIEVRENTTLLDRIAFLHFHESYHSGQTEFLRQLAGKNDAVIK